MECSNKKLYMRTKTKIIHKNKIETQRNLVRNIHCALTHTLTYY